MTKLEALTEQFRSAVERLQEVVAMPKDQIVRDSAIELFQALLKKVKS